MLRVMMNTPSGDDMAFDGPAVYRIRVNVGEFPRVGPTGWEA